MGHEWTTLEENHRDLEDQLAALRFLDPKSRTPTHAAVLLFAKDVQSLVPGAYVQLIEYRGEDPGSEIRRERRYVGDLLSVLRGLSELANELAEARLVEIDAMRERTVYDYPPEALRELFVNALIHRDYVSNTPVYLRLFSDRIEIQNPGGLYGDLRAEDFPASTAYRNPVLAESAKILGYVNRFGRGIPRVRAALQKNGSAAPEFQPEERHFLVTLWRRQ